MAVFRLLLVILDALFIILCMIECSGDWEASYSAVPYKMDFTSIFKSQIFKREKGSASNALPDSQRTAEPTAFPRVLTAFARFFAHIGWKKAVCQACVYLRNRCVSHTQDSAKQADFSPVCGHFPCVRRTHRKKSISLQPRG